MEYNEYRVNIKIRISIINLVREQRTQWLYERGIINNGSGSAEKGCSEERMI